MTDTRKEANSAVEPPHIAALLCAWLARRGDIWNPMTSVALAVARVTRAAPHWSRFCAATDVNAGSLGDLPAGRRAAGAC